MRIVPAFDELKNSRACLVWSVENVAVKQFTFQGGKEALAEGIVIAIADRAHRWADPGFPTALAKSQGSVLTAVIGVTLAPPARAGVDEAFWVTLLNRHVQGVHHQSGLEMSGHRPTHHLAAPGIHDDRQI